MKDITENNGYDIDKILEATEKINDSIVKVNSLKASISQVIHYEMYRRNITKKDMSKLLGISFPTFQKLLQNPSSQSIVLIESVLSKLQDSISKISDNID